MSSSTSLDQTPSQTKKYFIKTFGCQMNVADSERMARLMTDSGYAEAGSADEANVILVNGCTVRDKAVHKALSILGTYNEIKDPDPSSPSSKKKIIGVGGCVGQLEKKKLFINAPYIDFVFGTDTIDNLPELVNRVENGESHVVFAEFDKSMDYSTETKVSKVQAQAFVNIMKGCDKFCTYCIVPFTRGREKSRTIDEVLFDMARLVASGVREITLLGQNVNSFGKGNPNLSAREPKELHNQIGKVGPKVGDENFPQLLRAIDADPRLKALKRLRFTSSHPLDFSDELIDCYKPASQGGVSKLAPQLHLPVQSGSNRILSKMGRHHKIESYIAQMERLKAINPEVALSTDLIVGFPTETEEEFEETLRLLDRVQFETVYAFAYSPRPGTRAAKLPDDVSREDKNRRLNHLINYQNEIGGKLYARHIGETLEVLVEGEAKNQKMGEDYGLTRSSHRVFTGRTGSGRVVNFAVENESRSLVGMFVPVKITSTTFLSLKGELVHDADFAEKAVTA